MCTARSPRELLRDYISTFIAIYFEDFFDIFITISKQCRALDPPREKIHADGDVIDCSAFHYFGSVRKFVYDWVDSNQ